MVKVLVGVITYAGEKYCREVFFDYLHKITTPDIHFCFVTNSGEEDKKDLQEKAKDLPAEFFVAPETEGDVIDQIVINRNIVRDYFLQNDYDYLFFVDSDMIGPINAIDLLLSHKKKFTSGWALATFKNLPGTDGKPRVLPVAYDFDTPNSVRQMTITDMKKPVLRKVASIGLGCALIHKTLLDKPFERGPATEDTAFCTYVRSRGEDLWLDTRVAYWHLKFPTGDKRNAYLDPRRYLQQ